jgi:hypothetical protein
MSELPVPEGEDPVGLDQDDADYLQTHPDPDDPDEPDTYEGEDEGDSGTDDEPGGA